MKYFYLGSYKHTKFQQKLIEKITKLKKLKEKWKVKYDENNKTIMIIIKKQAEVIPFWQLCIEHDSFT